MTTADALLLKAINACCSRRQLEYQAFNWNSVIEGGQTAYVNPERLRYWPGELAVPIEPRGIAYSVKMLEPPPAVGTRKQLTADIAIADTQDNKTILAEAHLVCYAYGKKSTVYALRVDARDGGANVEIAMDNMPVLHILDLSNAVDKTFISDLQEIPPVLKPAVISDIEQAVGLRGGRISGIAYWAYRMRDNKKLSLPFTGFELVVNKGQKSLSANASASLASCLTLCCTELGLKGTSSAVTAESFNDALQKRKDAAVSESAKKDLAQLMPLLKALIVDNPSLKEAVRKELEVAQQ